MTLGHLVKQHASALTVVLISAVYFWSSYQLGERPDAGLIVILAIPAAVYFWVFRDEDTRQNALSFTSAQILLAYAAVYIASIYFVNIFGSSVALWLVQFVVPLLILKLLRQPLSGIGFWWSGVFAKPTALVLAAAFLTPTLLFMVRDSEQILTMTPWWRPVIYLPLSVIYMAIIVAFWEEFFFRGVVLSSLLRVTTNSAVAIFISSLCFALYHVPMRYMNTRSEYNGQFVNSLAATINEQFILGVFLGLIVYKSKNVWHGVWLHALINGVSFIYKLSQTVKF